MVGGVGVSLTSEQGAPLPPGHVWAICLKFKLAQWTRAEPRVNANRRKSLKRDLDISIKVWLVNRGLQIKTLLSPSF